MFEVYDFVYCFLVRRLPYLRSRHLAQRGFGASSGEQEQAIYLDELSQTGELMTQCLSPADIVQLLVLSPEWGVSSQTGLYASRREWSPARQLLYMKLRLVQSNLKPPPQTVDTDGNEKSD